MATRIFLEEGYLNFVDDDDTEVSERVLDDDFFYQLANDLFAFYKLRLNDLILSIYFSDIRDKNGNSYSNIKEFEKEINQGRKQVALSNVHTSPTGNISVSEASLIFNLDFEYTVDNDDVITKDLTGGGSVVQSNGMAVISTSITTGSLALLSGRVPTIYNAGQSGVLLFSVLFESSAANTEQYIGLIDEQGSTSAFKNGLVLGYDGTTFGFHKFKNDIKTTIPSSQWQDPLDGTGKSGAVLDTTKLNVFKLEYHNLPVGVINIFFETKDGEFIHVYSENNSGQDIEPRIFNANLLFKACASNKATTVDLVLKCSFASYFIEGKTNLIALHQSQHSTSVVSKSTVTARVPVLTIRNKATYAGGKNFITIILERYGFSVEASSANNLAEFILIKNGTLGGTPSFVDIHTNNSVVELDTSATSVSDGRELLGSPLAGKNDKSIESLTEYNFLVGPGETITLAAESDNSATMRGELLWKELI
jgi:hypothetical protein